MKHQRSLILIATILVALSAIIYVLHYIIFHDPHHIFIYMMGDLAFLPLEVLIVGIVVERILSRREMEEKFQKLNMVVGAFYSEIGNNLLTLLIQASNQKDNVIEKINVNAKWTGADFKKAHNLVDKMSPLTFENLDTNGLKAFLISKRPFMLTLIENPNLLEHERFTDLLLSVFHLTEELESRPSVTDLPEKDLAHIYGDINRADKHLIFEWLEYMHHLKSNYPFLYSHYLRIHPFQANPSAIIQ